MPVEITLGGVTIQAYAQKHAYISHRLGPAIQAAISSGENLTNEKIGEWISGGAYGALAALIPTLGPLVPEHVFQGYATAEAYAAGDYDEDVAKNLQGCPTIPEIEAAFKAGMTVNGIDRLVELGKGIVDPKLAKAMVNQKIAETISSPISPSPSGASDSTTSTTSPPTSTAIEASLSPVSPA
jgi:hypothetical protein